MAAGREGGEEFARVGACRVGDLHPADHPGQLVDPLISAQRLNVAGRDALANRLGDAELLAGARCHLRQVGDAEHLALGAELLQQAPDHLCHTATDARVDLVEHQRAGSQCGGADGAKRESDARQFAARSHPGERPWG